MTRVALVQVASPPSEAVDRRRERVGQMVAEAAGADLIVLPEMWLPGYFAFDRYPELAEPLDGDTVAAGREWAKTLGSFVHLGTVLERTSTGQLHNTAVLIDPHGEIVHTYRKIHVFSYRSLEADLITPGTRVTAVETPVGRLGVTTCYDLRFPELWRTLVDAGVQAAAVPAAWPAARREHWRLFTTTRAVEQQMFVLACNAVGAQGEVVLGGYSRVVDPWGVVLAEGADEEGITVCDVDPAVVTTARTEFPVLNDRRWP